MVDRKSGMAYECFAIKMEKFAHCTRWALARSEELELKNRKGAVLRSGHASGSKLK